MAIRELPGRPKPFMVYYDNPFTKRRTSASYATRQEAEKADALIKYRMKYERESFKPETEEEIRPRKKAEDIPDDSLEAIDAAYLQEKRLTFNGVRNHLGAMKIPFAMLARKRIGSITRKDIAHVVAATQRQGVKQTSVKLRMSIFYGVLRWAKKRGFIDNLPDLPEVEAGHPEHFVPPTKEEIGRIYEVAPENIKRMIVLGAKLGVRVGPSELLKLKWDYVDWDRSVLRVEAALKNKNEPWREVPIKKSLLPLFRSWWAHDQLKGIEYIISHNGRKVKGDMSYSWRKALKDAGITRRIRPYDLRHAFATEALAAGADVGTVARLMGHADATMVLKHYQHVMNAQKIAAVEALPDIEYVTNQNVTNDKAKVRKFATR